MIGIRSLRRPLLALISGIGIAAALAGAAVAAAPPFSTTLVIRGGSETTMPSAPSSGEDSSPVVLRGSPPSPPQASAPNCSPGYLFEPGYGCVAPSYAYEPPDYGWRNDYGYWPFWGFDGSFSGNQRHRFPKRFAHRAVRAPAVRFARSAAFGRGFAHLGGFAHAGGLGHR